MQVTFHNVTITMGADTPETAYSWLCNALDPRTKLGIVDFTTDTYSVEGSNRQHSTDKLFPNDKPGA